MTRNCFYWSCTLTVSLISFMSIKECSGSQYPPTFTQESKAILFLPEDTGIGTMVRVINASDTNGDDVTFTYGNDGGITASLIDLNQTKFGRQAWAELYLKAQLDRDHEDGQRKLQFRASDGKSSQSTPLTITLIINDVNDNKPKFDKLSYQFSVPENTSINTIVFPNISTVDVDTGLGGAFSYSLQPSGQSSNSYKDVFAVNGIGHGAGHMTANIVLKKPLDYEKLTFYQYTIKATDKGTPSLTGTADLIIKVTDVQDSPPIFLQLPYIKDVKENYKVEGTILKVTAEDGDRGVPNNITYKFVPQNDSCNEFFSLNNVTGDMTVAKTLDRDVGVIKKKNGVCRLHVNASETQPSNNKGGNKTWAETTVTITINDINDNWPTFVNGSTYYAQVNETLTYIPITIPNFTGISIMDLDQGDNSLFDVRIEFPNNSSTYDMLSPIPTSINADGLVRIQVNSKAFDYESTKNVTFNVTATERFNTTHKNSCMVHLRILDMNDNSPVFNKSSYDATIKENSPNGTSVLQLEATDKDSESYGRVHYQLRNGAENFRINRTSGEIYTNCVSSNLDYETKTSYSLTVEAIDGGGRSTPVSVTINLDDVNDNNPEFVSQKYEVSVEENEYDFSTKPFVVKATDKDKPGTNNSNIRYYLNITSDLIKDNFTMNATTGEIQIQLNKTLDFEKLNQTMGKIVMYAVAEDLGSPSLCGTSTVTIHVQDQNDNTPKFHKKVYNSSFPEGRFKDRNVIQISATDDDASDPNNVMNYYIDKGGFDRFFIDSKTGNITTSNFNFDRESLDSYNLTVIARDLGTPPRTGTATVLITITDVNDQLPRFGEGSYSTNVFENSTIGTFVKTCNASDEDNDHNLVYSIKSIVGHNDKGAPVNLSYIENYFDIFPYNGTVMVHSTLDREMASKIELTLLVNDTAGVEYTPQTATTTLTIELSDVNDNPPEFTNNIYHSRNIRESAAVNSIVITVSASDADVNNQINFTISENPKDGFRIASTSGTIYVKNSSSLDREDQPQMNITVMASDGTNNSTALIIVDLIDINDNAPVFQQHNATFTLPEAVYNDSIIERFHASDNDTGLNANVTYSIDGLSEPSLFFINKYTGDLKVNGDLDRETRNDYTLVILAKDNPEDQTNQKTGTATVKIKVSDINDNAPQFQQTYSANLSEYSLIDRLVLTVSALDKDEGINAVLQYNISNTNASNLFEIDKTTGVIRVNKVLTDKVGVYVLEVTAKDMGISQKENSTNISITINDENNHAPRFLPIRYTYSIYECARIGTFIANITATDNDTDTENKRVTYRFVNDAQTTANPFNIDQTTGFITVEKKLKAEEKDTYQLKVNASDNGKPRLSTLSNDITIRIKDVNDNPPEFLKDLYLGSVQEETNNTYVTTVTAVDKDKDSNTTYALENNFYSPNFEINEWTGDIYLTKYLDREKVPEVTLTVQAKDSTLVTNYSSQCDEIQQKKFNSTETSVRINVTDINDNPPVFTTKDLRVGVRRDVKLKTEIYDFKKDVTDRDIGINTVHTFKLLGKLEATKELEAQIQNARNGCPGSTEKAALCLSGNGTVAVNMVFLANAIGRITLHVMAKDAAGNDTATLNVILVGDSQTVQMTFWATKDEVTKISNDVMKRLGEILSDYEFVTHDIKPFVSEDGKREDFRTNLLFHVQEKATKRILSAQEAKSLFDQHAGSLVSLLKTYKVSKVDELQKEKLTDLDEQTKTMYVLVAVIALLGAIVLVLGYFLCSSISKYKRRLKAATIKTMDADSKDVVGFIPGSNEFAEKVNPLLNKDVKQPEVIPDDNDSQNSLDMNEVDYDNKKVPLSGVEEKEVVMDLYNDDYFVPDDNVDALQLALDEHNRQLSENYKNVLLKNVQNGDVDLGLDNPLIYQKLETTEV